MSAPRPDYGLDAPSVVRNLFFAAAVGLGAWGVCLSGAWSGHIAFTVSDVMLDFYLAPAGLVAGLGFLVTGCWMVWSSKAGKIREREHLLDLIHWTGEERVLDLGCGRGLMLVGAAKRLTTGKAIGVDIWQAEDLSGNRPEATLENARREGVSERVSIETADMRKLPFPEGTFDVVVSRAAIHNIYSSQGRAEAIIEVARVLKPGGHAIIEDIRHLAEYAETFARHGCPDAGSAGSKIASLILIVLTMGSLRPGVVHVKKTAG